MRATRPACFVELAWIAALLIPAVGLAQHSADSVPVRRDSVAWTDSVQIRAQIWAPVLVPGPFPTLLFSPGFGQKPAQYSTLLASWARQGYLVIAIEHPAFADPDNMELYDAAKIIARQLVRSLDHVLAARREGSAVLALVDPGRIGVVGHSIGGAAAAQACAWDSRFKAGMDLDGTIFGEVVHTGMPQPFFLIRQHFTANPLDPPRFLEYHDQASLHEDSVWAHSPTMYWLTVDGLDHMSFTDAALVPTLSAKVGTAMGLLLGAKATQEMTTRYVEDFFGHYLSGDLKNARLDRSPFAGTSLRIKRTTPP